MTKQQGIRNETRYGFYKCKGINKRRITMTTKAKHRWRSHKTNGRIIFKSKDKAHKEKYLGNILGGSEKRG